MGVLFKKRGVEMLGLILSVGEKVLILFLMIAVGAIAARRKILTREGASQLAELVLLVSTPCVIIAAFTRDMDQVTIPELLFMTAAAAVVHFLFILCARIFFPKEPTTRQKLLRFAIIYANVGFMGLPLLQSLLGNTGVVYASIFIAVFNIFCWTHGVRLMDRSGENGSAPPFWKCLVNPGTVGLAIGVPLFLLHLSLPDLVMEVVDGFSGLNTPLAMICIGVHISAISPKAALKDRSLLAAISIRLVLFPAVVLGILCLTTRDYPVFTSILLLSAMPSAANAVLFASRYHSDEQLASQAVAFSTLLSIITLPLLSAVSKLICG